MLEAFIIKAYYFHHPDLEPTYTTSALFRRLVNKTGELIARWKDNSAAASSSVAEEETRSSSTG